MNCLASSIRRRLAIGFAVVGLLSLATAVPSLSQLGRLGCELTGIAEINLMAVQARSALASLGIGALLAWRMTISVRRPVRFASAVAEKMAAGDLSSAIEVRSRDEFGRLMNSLEVMQQSLARRVAQVRQSSDSICSASGEISTGNQDLSERTEQAASSLQQTAASMGQSTGTLRQSADAAPPRRSSAMVSGRSTWR